jgi:hypothetical protein
MLRHKFKAKPVPSFVVIPRFAMLSCTYSLTRHLTHLGRFQQNKYNEEKRHEQAMEDRKTSLQRQMRPFQLHAAQRVLRV